MRTITKLKGLAVVLVLGVTLGCGAAGERQNGECVEDERCSPDVPNGLEFAANGLLGGVGQVAVGGEVTFEFDRRGSTNTESLGMPEVTVDGTSLEVVRAEPGSFTLRGLQAGASVVSVRSAADGAFWDRIELTAAQPDSIELLGSWDEDAEIPSVQRCGNAELVVFQAHDVDGMPVYDANISVSANAPVTEFANNPADSSLVFFELSIAEDHVGNFEAEVMVGDRVFDVELAVVECES